MNTNKRYSFKITVAKNDIDNLNHTNNLTYLKWVLLAAEKHWKSLSSTEINKRYAWVVLKHEISYFHMTSIGDVVDINTWIGNSYGVKSERYVEIYHQGNLCAKCLTIWCLMDKKTMKPCRIKSDVLDVLEGR